MTTPLESTLALVDQFRFKWVHLTERLAYEQAVKQQRMRTEISQVSWTGVVVSQVLVIKDSLIFFFTLIFSWFVGKYSKNAYKKRN